MKFEDVKVGDVFIDRENPELNRHIVTFKSPDKIGWVSETGYTKSLNRREWFKYCQYREFAERNRTVTVSVS